jgi:hypothetical protein
MAPVTVGTGTGTYQMIVDTGSTTLGVAASACGTRCAGVSPLYGDTGTDQHKTAKTEYADGSGWSGEIYQDTVELGGATLYSVAVDFVAISKQTSFFDTYDCTLNSTTTSADQGIAGFGNADLLETGTTSYFAQLVQANAVPNVFAVQMCNTDGKLWLGGYDPSAMNGAIQYTPITASQYTDVNLNALNLGSTSMGTDLNPVTIDTGTSVIGFSTDVYQPLTTAIEGSSVFKQALSGLDGGYFAGGNCLPAQGSLTTAQIDSMLPALNLVFPTAGGSSFTIAAPANQSYLTPVNTGSGVVYCAAVFDMGGNGQGSLLGDSFLQSSVTVFDLANNQIGFAPQKGCPAPPSTPPGLHPSAVKARYRNPHLPGHSGP